MIEDNAYNTLTARNQAFIPGALQKRLRQTTLVITGCGLGGVIAEAALRTGFTHIRLIDGDRVEAHNLNRQNFRNSDVDCSKTDAVAERLRAIHPHAQIESVPKFLDEDNAARLLHGAGVIVDTIDFRSPLAIRALHATAREQGIPVVAPMSVGWGGAALVFHPRGPSLADLLGHDAYASVPDFVSAFARLMRRYAAVFPPYALGVLSQILDAGNVCPISQLCPGSYTAAGLSVTLAVRIVAGETVPLAPELVLLDPLTAGSVAAAPELHANEFESTHDALKVCL